MAKTTGELISSTKSAPTVTGYKQVSGQWTQEDAAQSVANEAAKTAANDTSKEKKKTPTLQEQFAAREKESQSGINTIYETSLNNKKQGLTDAFNNSTAGQQEQKRSVEEAFKAAQYDVGVQNDRNDRNLDQFAAVRDMNYQGGSQHALSLGNARNTANQNLEFQRQQALAESQRQMAMLETRYKDQVAAALADNDYKRAAALMDDYQNQQKWREAQAQNLASFGDFTAYKDLYGDETAGKMQNMWNAQNPDAAYRLGRIDAETYKNITGKYPLGYSPPFAGFSWGDWNGYVPGRPGGGPGNSKLIAVGPRATYNPSNGTVSGTDNWQNIPMANGNYYTGTWSRSATSSETAKYGGGGGGKKK